MNYCDKIRIAEAEKKTKDREKAVDDSKTAKTPDEAWSDQDSIVSNKP